MPEPQPSGIPELDALVEVADREQRTFWSMAAVNDAEGTVSAVRQAELLERQQKARRTWSAAKGRLTKAQKDGDAEKIAAARKRCDAAYRECDAVSEAVIAEMHGIVATGLERNGQMLEQMSRSWDAGSAVIDALRPGGGR